VTPEARRYLAKARQCLARGEAIADYATGPEATVPLDRAAMAIATVVRFVEAVADAPEADAATRSAAG
jgi:hypothetical protein